MGDAFAGLPSHRPNVVRRANDLKGELAGLAAGRPDVGTRPFASFDGWTRTVRNALVWLGQADPVDTLDMVRKEDPRLQAREAFFAAFSEHGVGRQNRATTAEIVARGAAGALREILLEIAAPRGGEPSTVALGKWLGRNRDVIVNGFKLCGEVDPHNKQSKWFLECATNTSAISR